jgi:hypothetical protein
MLTEKFVSEIAGLAVKANGNRVFKAPDEPDHVYHTIDADGKLTKHATEPKPENNVVYDFESVAKVQAESKAGETWYHEGGVHVVHDVETRRDATKLHLTHSEPLAKLREWKDQKAAKLKQIEVYHLLRTTFAGCLNVHPTIVNDLRKVDVKKVQEATGIVQKANVSMSRSMVAEASGADKLPDVLTFEVPYWAEALAPLKVRVRVAFDLDPEAEVFRFVILPGEIEKAEFEAASFVHRRLLSALTEAGVKPEEVEKVLMHGWPG